MEKIAFKERVAAAANEFAEKYKEVFVDYEYLLCSDAFITRDYYIIDAEVDNFCHLIGVHTKLSPVNFFEKCKNRQLTADDFDFDKKEQDEKSVKGSVRRKITAFPGFLKMMDKDLVVQENFVKNKIYCTIATTDCESTMGFIGTTSLRPKTLLKGDQLDWAKAGAIELIMRRKSGSDYFDEIVFGDKATIIKFFPRIKEMISKDIYPERNLDKAI